MINQIRKRNLFAEIYLFQTKKKRKIFDILFEKEKSTKKSVTNENKEEFIAHVEREVRIQENVF